MANTNNLAVRWEEVSTLLPGTARWQATNQRLLDNPHLNLALTTQYLGAWLVAVRGSVMVFQHDFGWRLLGGADLAMLAATGFAFFRCRDILTHLYGYIRTAALDDTLFPRRHQAYWVGLRNILIILFLLSVFLYPLGIIGAFFAFHQLGTRQIRKLDEEYIRGTRLVSVETVNKEHMPLLAAGEPYFWFGGVYLPWRELVTHFKIVGGTRSGKTHLLRMYMSTVLPTIGTIGGEDRALLYDPKTQFYSFLRGLGIPPESIIIANVFDARGWAWDMARDFQGRDGAEALAMMMLPEETGGSGEGMFFNRAARRVLTGVARFFIEQAPGRWTFRDLVLTAQSLPLIQLLASSDRQLRRDLQVMGSGKTADDVMATVSTTVGSAFETIAAYMDHHQQQGRTFWLADWFETTSVLLLGRAPEREATLQPLNALLVNRFCELATSKFHLGYTHAIFDEVPTLGKLGKRLDELIRLGAEYRVSVAVVFQAYSSLKEMYGENIANALIGQCDKSAYLRVLDPETAKWCSEQIGDVYMRRWTTSTSTGTSSTGVWGQTTTSDSSSRSESIVNERIVAPETLLNIPKPDEKHQRGIEAYYKVGHQCYTFSIESGYIAQSLGMDDPLSPGFESMPNRHEVEQLRLWDERDLTRLNLIQIMRKAKTKELELLPLTERTYEALQSVTSEVDDTIDEAMNETI